MKKIKKIPTILGLIVLVVGAALGVYLTQTTTIFRLKATADQTPQDIKISNISDKSFTVSWVTDTAATAIVSWGESTSLGQSQSQTSTELTNIHYITVPNLKPNTTYYYKINSAGMDYDNAGIPWQTKTLAESSESATTDVISGTVVGADNQPQKDVIVYATANDTNVLSTQTTENGSWVIPLSFVNGQITNDSLLQIYAQGGNLGISTAQIYLKSANPVPQITLGQTYDFRNLESSSQNEVPKSSIDVPVETSQPESKIILSNATPEATLVKPVTIASVDEGETITTTQPEFFGLGPSGTKISITVHSDEQISDQVTVDTTGNWSWSVPDNLSPGQHSITISWTDVNGILRQLTRTFIVSAAEGPAFESSPSGSTPTPTLTPRPTASPTIKPSATPTASPKPIPSATSRVSLPATDSAIPVSGSLTPTLALSIIGIVLLILGIFLGIKTTQ